jgi:hypothetical protein
VEGLAGAAKVGPISVPAATVSRVLAGLEVAMSLMT